MAAKGPEFYDNDVVFQSYMQFRHGVDNTNVTMERPKMLELVGDVAGKRILELGCGDAAFGREALLNGCQKYLGVDGSLNMIAVAEHNLANTAGRVICANLETWDYPLNSFDLVLARFVLHYIADLPTLFTQVAAALNTEGRFVFSVEHPVVTAYNRAHHPENMLPDFFENEPGSWIVDDYFDEGLRVTSWLDGEVKKYHHTVECYFKLAQNAGLIVEQLCESCPQRERFNTEEIYQLRRRVPSILFFACRKHSA
jgi:SAM-dependent methyltransferase